MVDPAVAFLENQNYSTFDRGLAAGAYLKNPNGTVFKGLVWPGRVHFSYNITPLKQPPQRRDCIPRYLLCPVISLIFNSSISP